MLDFVRSPRFAGRYGSDPGDNLFGKGFGELTPVDSFFKRFTARAADIGPRMLRDVANDNETELDALERVHGP